jgi:polysaccharide export outer membrane protein
MKSALLNKLPTVLPVALLALLLALVSGCGSGRYAWSPTKDDPNSVALFHVGDDVMVTLSGGPADLPIHEEPIKEDGTITMPQIGKVVAVGKTAGQLQDAIQSLYVPGVYTHLTVTVKPGDRVYYVQGEVKAPGRQFYIGETTVTRAITSAGDFTDFADRKHVWLIRSSGKRFEVNCVEVQDHPEQDPPVYPGDQVLVKRSIW